MNSPTRASILKSPAQGSLSRRNLSISVNSPSHAASAAAIDRSPSFVSVSSAQSQSFTVTENDLMARIRTLESRCSTLEKERDVFSAQISTIQQESKLELENVQRKLEEADEKREGMQNRIDRVSHIETAMINLVIELKDRSSAADAVGHDLEAVAREREELRRMNPLQVIQQLRASLASLLDFKNDYENELKSQKNRRKFEVEMELADRQYKLESTLSSKDELGRDLQKAQRQLTNQEQRFDFEKQKMFAQMQQLEYDNAKLSQLLSAREEQLDELFDSLENKEKILEQKEMRMRKVSQLQTEIQKGKDQHKFDLSQFRARQHQAKEMVEGLSLQVAKLTSEKNTLEKKLKDCESQLTGYKSNSTLKKVREGQENITKLQRLLEQRETEVSSLKKELSAARKTLDRMGPMPSVPSLAVHDAEPEHTYRSPPTQRKPSILASSSSRPTSARRADKNSGGQVQLASYNSLPADVFMTAAHSSLMMSPASVLDSSFVESQPAQEARKRDKSSAYGALFYKRMLDEEEKKLENLTKACSSLSSPQYQPTPYFLKSDLSQQVDKLRDDWVAQRKTGSVNSSSNIGLSKPSPSAENHGRIAVEDISQPQKVYKPSSQLQEFLDAADVDSDGDESPQPLNLKKAQQSSSLSRPSSRPSTARSSSSSASGRSRLNI